MNSDCNNEDFLLIKRYRQGDKDALDTLINRYQNRLYNTILKMCSNPEDALELTQDSFVKAIENIKGFEGKSSFYTYLFRIGVNLTINFCKRRSKIKFASIDNEHTAGEGTMLLRDFLESRNKKDPSQIIADKESVAVLRTALADISEKYRVVLVLRDIEQMSYEQVSESLGIGIGTVKSRLFRARAMLKDRLMGVLGEDD